MTEKNLHQSDSALSRFILSPVLCRIRRALLFLHHWRARKARIKRFLHRVLGRRKRLPIAESDYFRLLKVIRQEHARGGVHRKLCARLRYLLSRADHLPLRLIPEDMVTMNSRFELLRQSEKRFVLTLVYPEDADKATGNISVVSYLGMSLLGRRSGEYISKSLRVGTVLYQPESRNAFHL